MYKIAVSDTLTINIDELSQNKTMNTLHEESVVMTLSSTSPSEYTQYAPLVGSIIDKIIVKDESDVEVFRDERPFLIVDIRRVLTTHVCTNLWQLRYFTPEAQHINDVMNGANPPSGGS